MRKLFQPADGPSWLGQILTSIRAALGDVWDHPIRLWPIATADQPTAADYEGAIDYDDTVNRIAWSDGVSWQTAMPYTAGEALTRVNDTNVTLTLGGTPATALLKATSITVGWSGTLAVGRGGTGVSSLGDITRVNDTNVTLTLGGTPTGAVVTSTSFTLGWTGTLATGRGGTGVSSLGDITRTNDTNVTLTLGGTPTGAVITSTSFTLGWSGTLAVSRGGTGGGSASGTLLDNITGFASTGHLVRTGSGTYAFRTVTGTANEITATNGDGVSGNPTLSLPAALTFTGKTVTGGTFAGVTLSGTTTVSGGQLGFPATQSASADANTLDDYEEGTWTPGVTFGGGSTGVTYGASNGAHYVKVGQLVFVSGRLILSAKGSSTGAAAMTGLPFTATVTNAASPVLGLYSNVTTITAPLFLNLTNGSSTAAIFTTPVTALTDANFQNTTAIGFCFCYRASA